MAILKKKKILIIDDEQEFGDVIGIRLAANDYAVETAATGEEGLGKVYSFKPHLVLLDVTMPGIDGFEVLRRLRDDPQTRHIPVIMLTARGESSSLFKAQNLGSDDYFIKPCDSKELLNLIKKYI